MENDFDRDGRLAQITEKVDRAILHVRDVRGYLPQGEDGILGREHLRFAVEYLVEALALAQGDET